MAKKDAGTTRGLIYKRILLKLSGEVLSGSREYGISYDVMCSIAQDIRGIYDLLRNRYCDRRREYFPGSF
jgi:hypothetical protein